jgi:hypothetical protein
MTSTTESSTRFQTEEDKVEDWRTKELIRVGYSSSDAVQIAARHSGPDAIDLHYACGLVEKGADPRTAADILL